MGPNYQSTREWPSRDCVTEATSAPSEMDALNGSGSTRRMPTRFWVLMVVLIVGLPFLFEASSHVVNQCPLSYEGRHRMREEWQKEIFTQEQLRYEWQREKIDQDNLRMEWKWEAEEHDRLEKERCDQEKHERQKMSMFWDQVEAHHCTTYVTREYTAFLVNLPVDYPHRIDACKETSLEIHDKSYFPTHCEDQGPGVVIGRWKIHNEPDRAPFWNSFKDKGCTSEQSGKRRFEHHLENLPDNGDWREFCATTPVSFHGMHFAGAQICFHSIFGVYGHWEIEDSSC
ncbi:hypothetical protein EDC04DRAFT_102029 [Pisolithus marmoratus]|nr:hypothetical protein EDC04DRAFT_102029 [Pisolithus marmoratus]